LLAAGATATARADLIGEILADRFSFAREEAFFGW
jgi:hypothetical protein